MPAIWDRDAFQESGFDSIKKFSGVFTGVDEDVEGQYGVQVAFHWEDVELIEAGEDVALEDQQYTDWVKQSSRKNSMNDKVLNAWLDAKEALGLEGENEGFAFIQGVKAIFEVKKFAFGKNRESGETMSGSFPVPVALADEAKPKAKGKPAPAKAPAAKTPAKAKAPEPDVEEAEIASESIEVSDALSDAIIEAVGEDGATAALIASHLKRKAATRNELATLGGIEAVLTALVDAEVLAEDAGTYTTA